MPQILASKLRSVGVISDRGLQIGKINDIMIDENTGKIISLVIKPASKQVVVSVPRDSGGNALIPFNAVMSIRDFVVINERVLAIQQLKGPRYSPALPSKE